MFRSAGTPARLRRSCRSGCQASATSSDRRLDGDHLLHAHALPRPTRPMRRPALPDRRSNVEATMLRAPHIYAAERGDARHKLGLGSRLCIFVGNCVSGRFRSPEQRPDWPSMAYAGRPAACNSPKGQALSGTKLSGKRAEGEASRKHLISGFRSSAESALMLASLGLAFRPLASKLFELLLVVYLIAITTEAMSAGLIRSARL